MQHQHRVVVAQLLNMLIHLWSFLGLQPYTSCWRMPLGRTMQSFVQPMDSHVECSPIRTVTCDCLDKSSSSSLLKMRGCSLRSVVRLLVLTVRSRVRFGIGPDASSSRPDGCPATAYRLLEAGGETSCHQLRIVVQRAVLCESRSKICEMAVKTGDGNASHNMNLHCLERAMYAFSFQYCADTKLSPRICIQRSSSVKTYFAML